MKKLMVIPLVALVLPMVLSQSLFFFKTKPDLEPENNMRSSEPVQIEKGSFGFDPSQDASWPAQNWEPFGQKVYVNGENATVVHLIPHTHDDLGWLKTIDEYFYGSRNDIYMASVQDIIDTVTEQLDKDPRKRFIYVEMGFLSRWWRQQSQETKEIFKGLVADKRLEIINGGWVMNDEANAYYEDIIDQMTLGHRFALEELGACPNVGWHIDPFGHSSTQAALFAQMGFDAFFFSRIDYQDKVNRVNKSALEMIWRPKTSQGDENAILAHVTFKHYDAPPTFCYDILCQDEPIKDDPELEGFNIDSRSTDFVNYFQIEAHHYRTNHILHTLGDDFNYGSAHWYFKNSDKLLNYIANYTADYFGGMRIDYSTINEYLSNISLSNVTFPLNEYDFFPYADEPNSFWGGYMTSRVNLKKFLRENGRLLQSVRKILASLYFENSSIDTSKLLGYQRKLEEAMGAGQHHDTVTGTSTQRVTNDAYYIQSAGALSADKLLQELAGEGVFRCNLNYTAELCKTSEVFNSKEWALVAIYNPGDLVQRVGRLKVPSGFFSLAKLGGNGSELVQDVLCSNLTDPSDCDLYFEDSFKANALSVYNLTKTTKDMQIQGVPLPESEPLSLKINENDTMAFQDYHFLYSQCQGTHCESFLFNLTYEYYSPNVQGQPSGVYIFRPDYSTHTKPISYTNLTSGKAFQGQIVSEFSLESELIACRLRGFASGLPSALEIETFVKPIPIYLGEKSGKEIVLRVGTNVLSNGVFYTDSNGMEMQKRIFNQRPTWNLKVLEPVAGNYYPINSAISVQNSRNTTFTLMNDRPQGGSAHIGENGTLELMIHRRILVDDWKGMGEPLNETDPDDQGMRAWMRHWLGFSAKNIPNEQRTIQYRNDFDLLVLYNFSQETGSDFMELGAKRQWKQELPKNLKYYFTLWTQNELLVRVHNMNDGETLEIPGGVYYFFEGDEALLPGRTIVSITERSLSNNQDKVDMVNKKIHWPGVTYKSFTNNPSECQLRPQEIRTYLVVFE